MSKLNEILITISNTETSDVYYAKSYPDWDFNDNWLMEFYKVPVFKIFIENSTTKKVWKGLRFMPYWNDPKKLDKHYKQQGWVTAGLSSIAKKAVTYYNPHYRTQNRVSPSNGAIQIKDSFLIHAGPAKLLDYGWGSAGCVEIIGNFDKFKNDIKILSNSKKMDTNDAIRELVNTRKLFVKVEHAVAPNLKTPAFEKAP